MDGLAKPVILFPSASMPVSSVLVTDRSARHLIPNNYTYLDILNGLANMFGNVMTGQ